MDRFDSFRLRTLRRFIDSVSVRFGKLNVPAPPCATEDAGSGAISYTSLSLPLSIYTYVYIYIYI